MTNANTGPNAGLFEPLQPAPYRITSTHHEAYALLPALIMVGITAVVALAKIYTSLTIFKKLRMDDYAVMAAMVRLFRRHVMSKRSLSQMLVLLPDIPRHYWSGRSSRPRYRHYSIGPYTNPATESSKRSHTYEEADSLH